MDRKSCFFIGHREADERLLPELIDAIERLITEEQVLAGNEDIRKKYGAMYQRFDKFDFD